MFESFGFESVTAPQAAVWLGALLGLMFGALAQITRFCLRRAIAGDPAERRPAAGVWLTALASALVGTQAAVAAGWIGFGDHRFLAPDLPVLAIILGGLAFGVGMVLTRGCVSRLTILLASGNLRALTVLLIFAITAHATLKGVLAGIRTGIGSVTVPLGETASLAALPGGALTWTALLALAALAVSLRSGARPVHLGLALALGLLVPAGWAGTGFVLYDDFDPVDLQSLSFTLPYADTLFWGIAATSIPANFGVGLIGGTLAGALILSLARREFRFQSFESPRQTGRYILGAVLMGFGGVLAGGCSVGAGLAGVPTLGLAALLALSAIAVGAYLARLVLEGGRAASHSPIAAA